MDATSEFFRVGFLAHDHFPADGEQALGPLLDQCLLTGDDGGDTGFEMVKLSQHGAEIGGVSRSLHELFLASGRVPR